jgi:glycosyltransferase 2 family protein
MRAAFYRHEGDRFVVCGARESRLVTMTVEVAQPLSAEWLRQGPRLFATPADEPRARRASDVIALLGAAVLLGVLSFAAVPSPGFASAVAAFLDALPDFLDSGWQFTSDLLVLFTIGLLIATVVRRRWSIARDAGVAVLVAAAVWLLVGRIVEGSWPPIWDSVRASEPPSWYPSPRIAIVGAAVLTVSPHLARPVRRFAAWIVVLAAFAVTALGATMPLGALAGGLVAVTAAAVTHLAFGSSAGRPGLGLVRSALTQLGVATTWLGPADRQQAGLFVVNATDTDGEHLVVKVYGRDAHDAALMSTLWRTVWYREAGSPLRFGRLQQVEHEAFLTLYAGQAGVRTDRVVTAGSTAEDDALLVLRRRGSIFAETGAASGNDDGVVAAMWELLGKLHAAGIAHGQMDDRHLLAADDEVGIIDFRGATVAPSVTQRRTDEVQALVTSTLLIGEERAVEAALTAVGADELTAMLPYVQRATLTSRQHVSVREGELDLDRLRTAAAAAVGTEAPALVRLRRVTLGSILRVGLPALAVLVLITAFAGMDLAELVDQVRNATWWLIVLAFLLTQVPRLTQALSTLGAAPVPLPLGPVYALQLAVSYVNLAIPTAAARVAVNIRFFQRHGVPPGSAIAAGAIDGFGGFVMQIMLLVSLLLFTSASLDLDVGGAVDSARQILVIVAVIVAAALLVVLAVARIRRFVLGWIKRLGAEAWGAVRGLNSPRRLFLLLGGNLATEVLFAVALATFVRAFGFDVGLGEVILINVSVALLAGLMPVPGGVGVTEGGLTFGLVQAGVPEEVALAIAVMSRMSSFYLPPIWGFFALRWLERNEHL